MKYRATIFLGSCLAFCIQPMVARTLLPHFGGGASVWVTCLATFQMLLLAGYWYAHRLAGGESRRDHRLESAARARMHFHLILLLAAAVWLGCMAVWGGEAAEALSGFCGTPAVNVALAVLLTAGPAYVLLSSNASLVQSLAGGDYRLYSVSNLGSFAGLFAHPLVLEPFVPVCAQWALLAAGALAYAVLLCWCGKRGMRNERGGMRNERWGMRDERGGMRDFSNNQTIEQSKNKALLWLLLPATSCFLLNATTAHITSDIAPLPLLWAVLLGLYLLSWTVGFSHRGERLEALWASFAAGSLLAAWAVHHSDEMTGATMVRESAAAAGVLFFGCCALHARLCRFRPGGAMLTRYNLFLAVGGAIGGALSGIAAPLVFNSVLEWPVALVSLACWCAWIAMGACASVWRSGVALVWLAAVAYAMMVAGMVRADRAGDFARGRSFYGSWRVYGKVVHNGYGKAYRMHFFKHGGTIHGFEPVDAVYRTGATCYYAEENGGLAFRMHPGYAARRPVRAGLVGLGVGTMAWYGRRGDVFRFYEICPQVAAVAKNGPWFDFVRNSKADVEVQIGDARQLLEKERTRNEAKWDVLVVDAYSGDSIPVQLMTEEAFRLYKDRLAPGGVLALHLSNWHVDLVPAAKAAAKLLGMDCTVIQSPGAGFAMEAVWAFLRERGTEGGAKVPPSEIVPDGEIRDVVLPTDTRGGLLGFLRFARSVKGVGK